MTTEIEKQFFDTFGIEPKEQEVFVLKNMVVKEYPEITDHILLELICILTRWHLDEREPYEIMSINMEQLKSQILSDSLGIAKCVKTKQQVRTLFEEGNEIL